MYLKFMTTQCIWGFRTSLW